MHSDPLDQFEADCAASGVAVSDCLKDAGVASTTYWRWRTAKFEPRGSTIRRLRDALIARRAGHHAQDAA